MLLMARGVTGAMSYTSEYYGSHGRPKGSLNWGFHSNIHFKSAPEGSDIEAPPAHLNPNPHPDPDPDPNHPSPNPNPHPHPHPHPDPHPSPDPTPHPGPHPRRCVRTSSGGWRRTSSCCAARVPRASTYPPSRAACASTATA